MRCRRFGHGWTKGALACSFVFSGGAGFAAPERSEVPTSEQPKSDRDDKEDIIVTGKLEDIAPVAAFDERAIHATGATTIADLLRTIQGATQSADGSEPIYLLNSQRVANFQEIGSLPPEALQRLDVLPEVAALKFGFPPTRRMLNFITKRHFKQNELRFAARTATAGGTATETANLGFTRLKDDRRITLGLEYRHTDPLFRSDRNIAPDPDISFDALGNVRGANGEIDPALSVAAGHVVRIAALPGAAADRSSLAGYLNGADKPRVFDVGPYRTLVAGNDAVKAEAVVADRIGEILAGSLSLSAEHSRDRSLSGLASATLTLPTGNPWSPFARPVLLDRYLIEAPPLRQRQETTTLRAGFILRGAVSGWRWDLTGAFDHKSVDGRNELNIDMTQANASIAAGANPFLPLDAGLLTSRLTNLVHTRSGTLGTKAMITNNPIRLPAGSISLTGTAEVERQNSNSSTRGTGNFDLHLGRTRAEAGLAIDVPLTSRREKIVPFIGDLSANGSLRARQVSGFGELEDSTFGLSWTPFKGVQLLGTIRHSATAPDMAAQSTPLTSFPNAAVFDYATGRTEVVTLTRGGNPDLAAEQRTVQSLGLTIKPWAKREWRLSVTFEDSVIYNQTGTVMALTPQTESLLPELLERDSAGRLVSVTYRPINFDNERLRALNVQLSASGQLAKPKPPGPGAPVLQQVPSYFGGLTLNVKFRDQLQLRPGTPALDLLQGDSVTGYNAPRAYIFGYGGISYGDIAMVVNGSYNAGNRVRNVDPAGDLRFSPILRFDLNFNIGVNRLLGDHPWTKKLQLRLDIGNLTDAHPHVRDASGRTPNRYQPDLLDPVGRTLTVTLRKTF